MSNLVERCGNNKHFQEIYKMVQGKLANVKYTADGTPTTPLSHTNDEIELIKREQFGQVTDNFISAYGTDYKTYDDVCRGAAAFSEDALKKCIKDGFYNPISGTGTGIDPSLATQANIPLLIGPSEVTALYSNGGISQIIIDKKSKGVLLNGYRFKGTGFEEQQLIDLQGHAEITGFGMALNDTFRDGNIYGGSVLFPIFNRDNPLTTAMTAKQLYQAGVLHKNCLRRWVEVDRWNTVVIPSFDLTAEDYLRPRSFYVPISGLEINSERASFVRPKPQPYWAAIQQLGWGEPDSVGYISAVKGYEIMVMSIPIMCQQMSLLVHQLPLDGIIAQNGPDAAKKWQKENEEQLRDWSMLNPKAINSYGEIAVVNRTYTGFDSLVDAIRKDVSAKSGIPESVIFFSQPNGIFNKTEEDVLLKQSETIRMIQKVVAPAINQVLPYIAVSCWGLPEGEKSWEQYQTLQIDFDSPVISSPSQKADIAQKYSQSVATLVGAGMPLQTAVSFVSRLASEVELPGDFSVMQDPLPQSNSVVAPPTNGTQGQPRINAPETMNVAGVENAS